MQKSGVSCVERIAGEVMVLSSRGVNLTEDVKGSLTSIVLPQRPISPPQVAKDPSAVKVEESLEAPAIGLDVSTAPNLDATRKNRVGM